MDGADALFVVLLFRHPHLLEGVQRGENGAADPGRVEPLLRRTNPNLDVLGRQFLNL